ncbi:trypsin-like serine peptidase [Sanguibacter suaedae]|uniref:V8-like Glu-specific endopeptidase n=1 Tax=Sanguibacter suaedae TaxID=2795737 RepID=A0A934MAK5_9MICO|nr:trypsin-like peptidase domain-containing protein [Sanguibacter suaedae]MBI9115705.1 hypothetical protein [Sanguibacter suaedae]
MRTRSPRSSTRARPRARSTAALSALLGLLVVGCAPAVTGDAVAGAKNSSIGAPISTDTVSLRHDYDSTPQEVNDYWTDERRGDAEGRDPSPGDGRADGGTDQPDGLDGRPDPATGVVVHPTSGAVSPDGPQLPDSDAGDVFDATGLAESTQGRLYVSFPDGDYVCSGTVVSAAGRNVVATAAHCLWDFTGDAGWGAMVLFVPDDADDMASAPYGYWSAEAAFGPQEFADLAKIADDGSITGEGWAYDFAFLTMAPDDSGQEIQDVTGGQGITFGTPTEELVVIGYPSAPPFDGRSQRYCSSSRYFTSLRGAFGIDCAMTQGSSGGGWLTDYDPQSGSGYLVATTSFGASGSMGGIPLGASALQLYTDAGGL